MPVPGTGRWREHTLSSAALRGNPLGDPDSRPLFVWTPPAYDAEPERRFPSLYLLHAMTAQARSSFNVAPFEANLAALVERSGIEAVVAIPDGFTSLGGAQWIDSPATGAYGSHLCDEIVGFVDGAYRTLAAAAHRGLAGTSSGGFGAAVWAMLRPDLFGGFACHAGDCLFEVTLARDFAPAAQALRNLYGSDYARFWADLRSGRPAFENRTDPLLQNVYACAAAFSPRPDGTVELPFAPETGALRGEVFARWLDWDPVRLAPLHAEALRGLRAVWVDAGAHDEYHLDLGATALVAALNEAGVAAEALHAERFEGGHRRLSRRLALSLPHLAARLGPRAG